MTAQISVLNKPCLFVLFSAESVYPPVYLFWLTIYINIFIHTSVCLGVSVFYLPVGVVSKSSSTFLRHIPIGSSCSSVFYCLWEMLSLVVLMCGGSPAVTYTVCCISAAYRK